MTNTLVTPEQLVSFAVGGLSDELVDVAAAAVRRDLGWHLVPRITETIAVESHGGHLLWLPTRSLPGAPVVVSGVQSGIDHWHQLPGALWSPEPWPIGYVSVTLAHGLAACPADLLPLLAQRADAASQPRDSRVTSFTNGGVQMALADPYQLDPELAPYAVLDGVS